MEKRIVQTTLALPAECAQREVAKPRRLIVLLHGFSETGRSILARFVPALPDDALVLAPNGPFPMPRQVEQSYKVGYSWYFYDRFTDEYLIDPHPAAGFVREIISKVAPSELPVTLVGFSQGGYLAPFVAQKLPRCQQVIGVASEFLRDELEGGFSCRFDGLIGAEDDVVSPDAARSSHEAMIRAGAHGDFHLVPGVGHRIEDRLVVKLRELLQWERPS